MLRCFAATIGLLRSCVGLVSLFTVASLFLVLVGCNGGEDAPVPVEQSTYRVGVPQVSPGSDVNLHIFRDRDACLAGLVEEADDCVPWVDRQSGETRFSFQFRDKTSGGNMRQPLTADQIKVFHEMREMPEFQLIPHERAGSAQLFIVVIDGSSSMYENDGEAIKKVYNALMRVSVAESFFPGDGSKTGVILLRFTSGDPVGLDGLAPKILRTKADYKSMVRGHLMKRSSGFTHLYNAARYSVTKLLRVPNVEQYLRANSAEPTIILLTDGFNNEAGADLCETNVQRLQETVDVIRGARSAKGEVQRPKVYAVGLGGPYRRGNKPKGKNVDVTTSGLCGKYAYNKINAGLETVGIDHVSLAWMAEAGGGISFVKRNAEGLSKVFSSASAESYRWFEVRYRVPDVILHRKSYDVRLELDGFARAISNVTFYPGAWMDGPPAPAPGQLDAGKSPPFRATLTVVMPILGVVVTIAFLGPAIFNARRAVFRRAKLRSQTTKNGPSPAEPAVDGDQVVVEESTETEPPSTA